MKGTTYYLKSVFVINVYRLESDGIPNMFVIENRNVSIRILRRIKNLNVKSTY